MTKTGCMLVCRAVGPTTSRTEICVSLRQYLCSDIQYFRFFITFYSRLIGNHCF